jgi:rsbT antagonist protein RsbS
MAVPILKQGRFLIASIQSALTDQDLIQFRDDLADLVGRYRAKGVIVDVTALDVLDSFATRTLRAIAYMTKLRGAETVIVASGSSRRPISSLRASREGRWPRKLASRAAT